MSRASRLSLISWCLRLVSGSLWSLSLASPLGLFSLNFSIDIFDILLIFWYYKNSK